jgi:dipeptidyl aminopeptidase/acylaminoacyl peptidase
LAEDEAAKTSIWLRFIPNPNLFAGEAHIVEFERVNIEQFFRTYSITSFAVSKDESQIALSTNLSGTYDVWSISPQHPYPVPLTTKGQVPHEICFSPAHDYLLVSFDHDGDENAQLYALSPQGGALKPLRQAEGRRHMGVILSEDGKRIYYTSDKDNHSFLNTYLYDIEQDEEKIVFAATGAPTYLAALAKDESSFVTLSAHANTFVTAHLHQGDEVTSLTPDDTVSHVVGYVEYAEDTLYLATNYDAPFSYFASYDLATGAFTKLFEAAGMDVTAFGIDTSRQVATLLTSGGVEDKLVEFNLSTGQATVLTTPFQTVGQLHVAESGTVYVLGQSDIQPRNIYARKPGGDWDQITRNRILGVEDAELSSAETIKYPSFDGLEVEALIFPANPATENGYTVIWPHGGPQAAERRAYRAFFQFLTYCGYQVFAPNFRGSTGYGAEFVKMVEGDWGHGPRLDMVEGVEWLLQSGRATRDKLFLVGGSYGGYMTLLLHGRHADYFQACVDIFGPCNLFTFLESVPDHWKPSMKQWLGDPIEDKERLTQDSPITYLSGMTKPMLVIQGANDPRVVKAESDQIVEALRAQGTDVEYIVFDDEGHGFSKKENEIEAYGKIVAFLDQHRQAAADSALSEAATQG